MKDKLPKELVKEEIKQTSKQEGSASPSGSASPGSRKKIEPVYQFQHGRIVRQNK